MAVQSTVRSITVETRIRYEPWKLPRDARHFTMTAAIRQLLVVDRKNLDELISTSALLSSSLDDLDSLSELSQVDAQRLQMVTDRYSQLMETLSNLLKSMSDTESSIVQNLK